MKRKAEALRAVVSKVLFVGCLGAGGPMLVQAVFRWSWWLNAVTSCFPVELVAQCKEKLFSGGAGGPGWSKLFSGGVGGPVLASGVVRGRIGKQIWLHSGLILALFWRPVLSGALLGPSWATFLAP